MSELHVPIATIDKIEKAANSDFLDCVWVKGWTVITSTKYQPGDKCIYLAPDCVLDKKLISHAFPDGMEGKVKPDSLEKHRMRAAKIRKNLSQGMILNFDKLVLEYPALKGKNVGDDVAKILNVTKYEPPVDKSPMGIAQQKKKVNKNPDFKEYTDIDNYKWFNDGSIFKDGDLVYITEKLHGTSARYGILPTTANTIWKKILRFFNLLPEVENCIGSRKVQVHLKNNYKGFYGTDVYSRMAKELDIFSKLCKGEVVYGEIVGPGIQAGYTYGCKQGELKFFAYDVMRDGRYLDSLEFIRFCKDRKIPYVPVLDNKGKILDLTGLTQSITVFNEKVLHPFSESLINDLIKGDSTIGGQKVREGIVLKFGKETNHPLCGRVALKHINPDYLVNPNNTDFH